MARLTAVRRSWPTQRGLAAAKLKFSVTSVLEPFKPSAAFGRNQKQLLRGAQDDVILSERSEAKNLFFFSGREEVRPW